MSMTHLSVEPAILYLGTPVVLISSINEDGSPNLAPMSSAFWLQHMQQDFGVGHLTTECVLISFVDNDDREIERGNSCRRPGLALYCNTAFISGATRRSEQPTRERLRCATLHSISPFARIGRRSRP